MPRATDLRAELGRMIEVRRKEMNLTQKAIGARCGMSHTAISHLESGRTDPKLTTICRLAEALEMPVAHLLADAEDLRRLDAEGS